MANEINNHNSGEGWGEKKGGEGAGKHGKEEKEGGGEKQAQNEQKSETFCKNLKNTVKKQCYLDLAISASILVARS